MIAYLLAVGFFGYCLLVGSALQYVTTYRMGYRTNPSLAASMGLACTLLLCMFLNRLGLSVNAIARPLLALMLTAALLLLWVRGPIGNRKSRALLVVFLTGAVACISIGIPLATHGLGWLSFCNNDMIYYCTGATRLLQHGFSEPPSVRKLLDGQDLAAEAWFPHVVVGHRNGAEYLLALVSAAVNLSPTDVYMSVIASLLMVLSVSLPVLLTSRHRNRFQQASIAVSIATPLCGPILYGFLNQLLAQSLGLILSVGLLAAARAHILVPSRKLFMGRFSSFVLFLLTLLYTYVEILPFAVLAVIMLALARMVRTRGIKPLLRLGTAALMSAATLNVLLVAPAINLLANVSGEPSSAKTESLFPYFLKPVGLLHFWGWLAFGQEVSVSDFMLVVLLSASITFFLATTFVLVRGVAMRSDACSAMALSMLCAVPYLFMRQNDFGLFKISMFIFPFLVPPLVASFVERRPSLVRLMGAALLPSAMLSSPQYIADAQNPQRCTIPFVDRSGLVNVLSGSESTRAAVSFVGSTPTAAALFRNQRSFAAPNYTTYTPGYYVSAPGAGIIYPKDRWHNPLYFDVIKQGPAITQALGEAYKGNNYLMPEQIEAWEGPSVPESVLRVIDPSWPFPKQRSEGSGALTFLPTSLSQPFYGGQTDRVAFWQPELIKTFGLNEYQMAIGRDITFKAHDLPEKPVLVFSYSTSLAKSADLRLRPVEVFGSDGLKSTMRAGGIGMLRGWVAITPQRAYRLATNRVPEYFPQAESPVQSLWGAQFRLDPRKVTGFMRELRVIGASELPPPPYCVEQFPDDLLRADTFFSGICEDGWVANVCEVRLRGARRIHIQGEVPDLGGDVKQQIKVYVNGVLEAAREYSSGRFLLKCDVGAVQEVCEVSMECSASVTLPFPDGRPVCVKVEYIKVTDQAP